MSERYVAVIKVIKVEQVPATAPGQYSKELPIAAHEKDTELASLVVRNISLSGLINKTKKHLDLVDEEKAVSNDS